MKVVILAGGFGTRISEESRLRPKPMVEIGAMPILWHIMKCYSAHGFNDFVICCGYKQHVIKTFFANYYVHQSDITFDLRNNNKCNVHITASEPWRVTLVDTGLNTMTGGRIKRIRDYTGGEPFLLTYGDGVADVDITSLVEFHKSHGKALSLTAVSLAPRFGVLSIDSEDSVVDFREKQDVDGSMINGGFMVCNPKVFDYIDGDDTVFEQEPLMRLAHAGELKAFRHNGFWKCMDTQRDMEQLNQMWAQGEAPWKQW